MDGIGYLVLRNHSEISSTTSGHPSENQAQYIEMGWNQICEIRYNAETKKAFLVVLSEFDFKGYANH